MWPCKRLVNKPYCEPCSYQTKWHMMLVQGSFCVDNFESMRVRKCKSELASHTENCGLGNKSNDAFISKDKGT